MIVIPNSRAESGERGPYETLTLSRTCEGSPPVLESTLEQHRQLLLT